ncbi:hypothetical protein Q5P01_010683 [Channa striata]|uniref:E3 ubiquitin-protein ligase TRIM39-like n=1 Tax=Channa striata TaxID=64152 RepID=A0AA88MSY8_CHASR|nr:hypothetical protein Q5P01_010683 [Channa striata]
MHAQTSCVGGGALNTSLFISKSTRATADHCVSPPRPRILHFSGSHRSPPPARLQQVFIQCVIMSATSCVLFEEQFLCCICLDVFTDPVTIPCGHNFCKNCITQNWKVSSVPYQCPMCKKQYKSQPELQVNTFISEMAAEFRQSSEKKGSESSEIAKSGEIPCDVCTGPKLKALKSCFTCLASYCGIHLHPHKTADALKRHLLSEPVENMEGRVCTKHKQALELFCRTDRTCVCQLCMVSEHAAHNIASLREEVQAKKSELVETEAAMQKIIQERQLKIQQIKRLKVHGREDAEREIADGVRIFTVLIQTAERGLNELIEKIEERQKVTEDQADGLIQELEQEISALMKRVSDLRQLSRSEDHLTFFQTFETLNTALCVKNRRELGLSLPSYEGTVVAAVAELDETLLKEKRHLLYEARLKRVQHYAVDVILEPHTANPWLVLSDDGKQVSCGEVRRSLPDNTQRFSLYASVLAKQSFSSGRCYFEVQVTGKTDWTLGMVNESVNRKGIIPISPVNGYWALGLRNGNEYLTLSSPVVTLSLDSRLCRVGVFLSYEDRLVSFYDVDAAVHLYSFTNCCFTEKLFPFFSPGLNHGGTNSAPLIISPVDSTD